LAGYLSYWTISNLRQKLPDIKEDEIKDSKTMPNLYGNPTGDGKTIMILTHNHIAKYEGLKCGVRGGMDGHGHILKNLHYRTGMAETLS
jgi:hypothetical protein